MTDADLFAAKDTAHDMCEINCGQTIIGAECPISIRGGAMKLSIHDISMSRVIDGDNLMLRVEYTPEGGDTTIDYGQYIVSTNSYYPGIDMEDHEEEYYALQERVEAR